MYCVKKSGRIVLLSSLFLLVACSGSRFKTDFDFRSGVDFDSYKTFSWLDDQPLKISTETTSFNPLVTARIENAVRTELERKGFQFQEDPLTADFVLSFTLGSRDKLRVTSYPVAYRGVYGWGRYYHGRYGSAVTVTETSVDQYEEGTLAIDVFDTKIKEPVWHGKATGALRNERDKEAVIVEVVNGILVNFPPSAESGD